MRSLIILLSVFFITTVNAQPDLQEALKPLDILVGEWKVEADMRLSKNGPWEKSEARSVIKKEIGNTIFEEEYNGTKQGRVLTMKSWLGNDNRTKLYQRIAVDSDHGVLIVFEGKLDDRWLTLEAILSIGEIKIWQRVQYKLLDKDSFIVESSRSTDEGKTWDRTGSLTYQRIR